MVTKELAKDSPGSVRHQCIAPDVDNRPICSDNFVYALHWDGRNQMDLVLPLQSPGQQAEEENEHHDLIHGPRNELSLTLGSDMVKPFKQTQAKFMCPNNFNGQNPGSFNSILQSSSYLKPAQELLDEVVCVSNALELSDDEEVRKNRLVGMLNQVNGRHLRLGERINDQYAVQENSVQAKLIALLNELESRYEQYFHQMEQVVSSFEEVIGRGAAICYTALTIQAMSRHFANLRDAIISQIHASVDSRCEEYAKLISDCSKDTSRDQSSRQKRETLRQLGTIQIRQVWRPLRGLPEDSVGVLRAWLFEHFLHPYPNDNEKLMLASRTGLTRNQISNWFINARVRLWKPMIEEMYKEEFSEDSRDVSVFS
ncbi:BEL1-like homeodomain protein 11 isoform X1 [Typha latifolia]|uniref:BEL1-like homeodomain protein 11 isoform X1 n=2 Tax=Typha latifolia TaxID=4733 RepID=UPI003C2CB6B1